MLNYINYHTFCHSKLSIYPNSPLPETRSLRPYPRDKISKINNLSHFFSHSLAYLPKIPYLCTPKKGTAVPSAPFVPGQQLFLAVIKCLRRSYFWLP